MKLKNPDYIEEYTVQGNPFNEGLQTIYKGLLHDGINADVVIYVDTKNNDIDITARTYFKNLPETHSGQYIEIEEIDGNNFVTALESWSMTDLESCIQENEVNELREKFKKKYSDKRADYDNDEDFFDDYSAEYEEFLFYSGNEAITDSIEDWIDESSQLYVDDFIEKYVEVYDDLTQEEEQEVNN